MNNLIDSQNGLPEPEDEDFDPFAPENIPVLSFIALQRIYDALMLNNVLQDFDATKKLHELHAQGKLLGTSPNWDGIFMGSEPTDEV